MTMTLTLTMTLTMLRLYSLRPSPAHEVDHDVLDSMFQEFEHTGDYLAASQALEMMAAQVIW